MRCVSSRWCSELAHCTSGSTRASRFNPQAISCSLACSFLDYLWAERETARRFLISWCPDLTHGKCLNKTLRRYVWLPISYVFINFLSRSALYLFRCFRLWLKYYQNTRIKLWRLDITTCSSMWDPALITANGVDCLGDTAGQGRKSSERRHDRKMILKI